MKSLGMRAEKDCVYWALVEGTGDEPVLINEGKFAAPKTYDEPKALTWYRERLKSMIDEFEPDVVAVRYPESYLKFKPRAPSSLYARGRIEGGHCRSGAVQRHHGATSLHSR
jgi:hypothetical protein